MTEHKGLPVAGYRAQPKEAVAQVNQFKVLEERLLRILDGLEYGIPILPMEGEPHNMPVDRRWLAIGRTHLEQAFMCINRSIFKPERVRLEDEDAAQA